MERPEDPSLHGSKVEFEGVIKEDRQKPVSEPEAGMAGETSPFKDAAGPLGEILRSQSMETQQVAAQLLNRAGYGDADVRLVTSPENAGQCLQLVNEYSRCNKAGDAAGIKRIVQRLQAIMDE